MAQAAAPTDRDLTSIQEARRLAQRAKRTAPLLAELRAALGALDRTHEIVWVDDGSSDGTGERLREEARAECGRAAGRERHDQAHRLVRILR